MLFEYIVSQKGRRQHRCFPGCCFIVHEVGDGLTVLALICGTGRPVTGKVGSGDSVPGWNSYFK